MVVSASLFCDFRSERPPVALRPLQPTCRRTGSLPSRHSVAAEPLGASDGQTLWSLIAGTPAEHCRPAGSFGYELTETAETPPQDLPRPCSSGWSWLDRRRQP